jgi:hypothetical protein
MLRRTAVALLALCVAAVALAQPGEKKAGKSPTKPAAVKKKSAENRPTWAELTADQQMILAPLKDSWTQIEPDRRRNWVGIANRYPRMDAKAQERVQRRMQRWATLTPEQRRQARENYKRLAKQRAERRSPKLAEAWREYQALPPDERDRLAPPQ